MHILKLLSGPEMLPMVPAEPNRSVEKYQIIQLYCAGMACLNNEAIDKISFETFHGPCK
jgi:hypothetical protein